MQTVKTIIAKYKSLEITKETPEYTSITNSGNWNKKFEAECEAAGLDLYYTTNAGGKDYKIKF